EVVISEIMYNPPPLPAAAGSPAPVGNSDNQWIEIANRSAGPIALDGWEFDDGVSFVFPAGVSLAAGEHACIARDAVAFANAYPGARLLGEFDGSLSRSAERIHLRDDHKNPVDEVRYHDSGRWPVAADGGGASLELRDLDADNSVAESWAASDETARSGWREYTYGGTVTASAGPDSKWSEFNLGLLGAGEVLIDDIRVIENGSTQKITPATFSRGASGWRFRGTHRHSEVVADPDDPGNKVLRLVATGPTEHMHNQAETTLLSPASNNRSCEISFRARWVSGSNQLHTRLYFNRLPKVTSIDRPAHVGTPSAPNSRAETNIGPSITEMIHAPAVPGAGAAVSVTARSADPDGVAAMRLFYSVNGGGFQNTAMGAGADGVYQGTIPGQSAAAVVQFYIEAGDGLGATSMCPAAGPDSRALYKVDDGLAATNGQHNFRIVVTNAERDFIHQPTEVMSNDRIGATIIDREEDIYYDVKLRLKGSERARNQTNRVGYNMRFGRDNLYRGIHGSLAIDRSEGQVPGQFEILFDLMMANSGGVVSRSYDFIKVMAPKNQHTRSAVLQMARYDDVFLDSQFENGADGNLYEYELLYTPNSADSNGFKLPEPDGVTATSISDKGDDKENYRWFFLKKNNREKDDFAPIIAYNKKFSQSGRTFDQGLEDVVDVDGWLRGMAYAVLSGAGDNAGAGSAHNGMYYARPDGRVMFLPHDMDFMFDTSRSIFANSECAKLTADPARKRIYLGHLQDIISTTYNGRRMSTWTRHLATFDPGQNWAGHLNYISSRSGNVLTQISGQIPSVPFAIAGTSPMSVSSSPAIVSGDGWVDVREIRLAGSSVPLELSWTEVDSWRVVLPVAPGEQVYTLEALNFSGAVIGSDSITIDNSNVVELASAGNLVISELMYHPTAPTLGEIASGHDDASLFEFVELANVASVGVDLTGVRFSSGIIYALASAVIPAGGRMVLARNRAAFLSRHPGADGILLAGEYGIGDTNKFANGGEQIALIDATGADIVRFTYGGDVPWPAAADGEGPSLVLISPESGPDPALAGTWRSSALVGGNPGTSDAVAFAGEPNGDTNGNGVPDLVDHAVADDGQLRFTMSPDIATLEFVLNLAADDVVVGIEISTNLQTWHDGSDLFARMDLQYQGGGRQRVRYHADRAVLPHEKLFIRLMVRLKADLARLRLRPKTTRPKTQDKEFDLTTTQSRFQGL
ncbi:MAG: lamin tail domain-containing protein, partial [Akkermansiaceae bacterium]|nr:lamin tail domain-containing protein [Akkermansiaceae bacterium]